MATRLRYLLPCVTVIAAVVAMTGHVLGAEPERLFFGDMELPVQHQNWTLERPAPDILHIVPAGPFATSERTIVVTQATSRSLGDCEVLARAQLPLSLYRESIAQQMAISGQTAVILRAPTRCRNATPGGVAICIPHNRTTYVLTYRIASCRNFGGTPYSGNGFVDELTSAIRFRP
jgi:hypothetical protein